MKANKDIKNWEIYGQKSGSMNLHKRYFTKKKMSAVAKDMTRQGHIVGWKKRDEVKLHMVKPPAKKKAGTPRKLENVPQVA